MRTNNIILIIIISFIGTLVVSSQNARQHYKAGIQFTDNKYYSDAIEQFNKAMSKSNNYCRINQGRTLDRDPGA